ncbi:hypothetical protein [Arthrobacter bambusae]|uniref:hypothetical protein n=1 Tax=Arthrobacter bambusae TaxID=1338426 RepID=UPI002782E1ED|nr:hypothetical protein [Arthrobacter bambusae]MDQ0030767.1 hypothetical protein [Arthrobacter bambusae]MDQ0098946.1 hypothetical protein [Arthrobacter bambusae]
MKPGNDLFYDPLGPSPATNPATNPKSFAEAGSAGFAETNPTPARNQSQQPYHPDANRGRTHPPAMQTHPDTAKSTSREAALQSVRRDLERLARLRRSA